MPCRDDWPDPTAAQAKSQRAAGLLITLYEKLGHEVPEKLRQDAKDCYCSVDYVNELCGVLTDMGEEERDAFIYVARDKQARALADWWEEHQEEDRAREAAEKEERRQKKVRAAALKKLTKEEIDLLEIPTWRWK